mmetsp:Transcript_75132/g.244255  ORF Transcript_75132/g.244255 Transcript_75132/m.244255 type:complete len:300 (+) Transcript_75132:745-1644(+)
MRSSPVCVAHAPRSVSNSAACFECPATMPCNSLGLALASEVAWLASAKSSSRNELRCSDSSFARVRSSAATRPAAASSAARAARPATSPRARSARARRSESSATGRSAQLRSSLVTTSWVKRCASPSSTSKRPGRAAVSASNALVPFAAAATVRTSRPAIFSTSAMNRANSWAKRSFCMRSSPNVVAWAPAASAVAVRCASKSKCKVSASLCACCASWRLVEAPARDSTVSRWASRARSSRSPRSWPRREAPSRTARRSAWAATPAPRSSASAASLLCISADSKMARSRPATLSACETR